MRNVHLICNAHLDPVWQWRWEEGCAEALSTFSTAVQLLEEDPDLVFNHNEAVLYRWVERYRPELFTSIQELVAQGRWFISGGWYLQPDVNIPGLESIIRHIEEGRRYFADKFGVRPRVAYNFDSFGHGGGLPQVLLQTGFDLYIHMRPQEDDLELPSDLYRWRGVDGSLLPTLRISNGLYHTERDNLEKRLRQGVEQALHLDRDTAVFWGLGDHGGGATRVDLETIRQFRSRETRVQLIHSTPDRLYESLKDSIDEAPVVEGDIQRVFVGCYTSLARLKKRCRESLGGLVQTETLRALGSREQGLDYPFASLDRLWRDHLFNDFHDILPGTCIEPAERDALDLYGRVDQGLRALRLEVAAENAAPSDEDCPVSVTILHANPAVDRVPIEVEFMVDHRPLWTGTYTTFVRDAQGREIPSQEEQPEARLPFNGWRRRVVFMDEDSNVGSRHFRIGKLEGHPPAPTSTVQPEKSLEYEVGPSTGLVTSLGTPDGDSVLAGSLFEPIVVNDDGDSWGSGQGSWRDVCGRFLKHRSRVLENGSVRKVHETELSHGSSSAVIQIVGYGSWPVLEYRVRIHWTEVHRRLRLLVPTVFESATPQCEIPGGLLGRPADGQEHVHGRWIMLEGTHEGQKRAIGLVHSAQHGFDCIAGTVSLSVLRSAAYCHERTQDLSTLGSTKLMDQGVHEFRLLAIVGSPDEVRSRLSGLADWLDAPPVVLAHLPSKIDSDGHPRGETSLLSLEPRTVRLHACRLARDGKALLVRLQECVGERTEARLTLPQSGHTVEATLEPLQVRTFRIERDGTSQPVSWIEET